MAQGAVVYEIKNNITGQVYIGVTVDFERRKRDHFRLSNWAASSTKKLYKNMAEYGHRNFSMRVVSEHADEADAYVHEKALIRSIKSNYKLGTSLNRGDGGERRREPVTLFVYKLEPENRFNAKKATRYGGINAAARELSLPQPTISVALSKENRRVKNYVFANSIDELRDLVSRQKWSHRFGVDGVESAGESNTGRRNASPKREKATERLICFLNEYAGTEVRVKTLIEAIDMPPSTFRLFRKEPEINRLLGDLGWEFTSTQRLERVTA